jgi:hypothetical protein
MSAGEDEIYRSVRLNRDGVDFSQWPKLSCSAANELTLATKDDPNPGFARLAIAGELKLQAGVAVNELSSDEKLTNNSDLAIPTQKAVKTYVDNQIAVVNQSLSTKAALAGATSQDFQSKNLSVSGNLTANGNVSIGTTSSSYKLAIAAGDINIDDGRALRQAGRWVIGGDSNVLSLGSSNAPDGRDIRFDPGFAGALTIKKDTGNVGIGTTEPQTKLDVAGDLQVKGDIQINGKSLADTIKKLTEKLEVLQRELQEKTTQLDSLNREVETTKNKLQETRRELESTRISLTSTSNNAQNAQRTADIARSEVNSLRVGIESGSIIAQKALMLRARDDNHWMRCRMVDVANHDVFELWRSDGQWFSTVRVESALKLRARDDHHWMRCRTVDGTNHDVFELWRSDNNWFSTIRVDAALGLIKP